MSALLRDIRYALRMLVKQPGFTVAAVLTMGLSIAATTIVFSLADKLVVHPYADVPYHDRLVWFFETDGKLDMDHDNIALANYVDWKAQAKSFDHIGFVGGGNFNASITGHSRMLNAIKVSPDFFEMMGTHLTVGHGFDADADVAGHDHVVVISDDLWRDQFARRPDVVGQTLTLDGESWQVVGVLPPRFALLKGHTELYVPLVVSAEQLADREKPSQDVIGRLREGVTIEEAKAELHTIAMRLAKTYPATNTGKDATVVALDEMFVGFFRSPVYLLLAAVGFVLLIGCANVSNLLLSRAILRRREAAIRAAIGTTAARLVRQLLTESIVLALLGCGLGILLAWWGIDALVRGIPAVIVNETRRVADVSLNGEVLAAAILISILTGLLFGLVPALRIASTDVVSALKDGDRGGTSTRGRVRDVLIAVELALATVLLVAAGMSSRALAQSVRQPLGFEPAHALIGYFNLPIARYPAPDPAKHYPTPPTTQAFIDHLIARVSTLPGVTAAALSTSSPLETRALYQFIVEGDPPLPPAQQPYTAFTAVTPAYLDAAKLPLLAGRMVNASDVAGGPSIVLVSSALARRYFPDGHAIGRRIRWPEDGTDSEIVGIVGDTRAARGSVLGDIHVYGALSQINPWPAWFVLVRTKNDASSTIASLRALIEELDSQAPIGWLQTLTELVDEEDAPLRFLSVLLAVLAILGLVLAAIGTYGVMSYAISQRTNEIGIRMALGAQSSDVVWLVLRRGIIIASLGLGVGVAASLALARVASALLFGAPTYDPIALAGSSLVLFTTACIACYLPARRATLIDPLVALRSE